MNEAKEMLAQFEHRDLWHEANNLVVALNLSVIDEHMPFDDNLTNIAICDDLFDHLVEVEMYMQGGYSLEYGLDCVREIWEQVLKLDRGTFEAYRLTRNDQNAFIEAISVNNDIGCAIQISLYPANNVIPFPTRPTA